MIEKGQKKRDVRHRLLELPALYAELLGKKVKLERAAKAARARAFQCRGEMTADMMAEPEQYGLTPGGRLQKSTAAMLARNSRECRELSGRENSMVNRIMEVNAELEAIRFEAENLRCILASY